MVDHGGIIGCGWTADWKLVEKLLPLIGPNELPEYHSKKEGISPKFIEACECFFRFLFCQQDAMLLSKFEAFCDQPPRLGFHELTRKNAPFPNYSDEVYLDKKAASFLKSWSSNVNGHLCAEKRSHFALQVNSLLECQTVHRKSNIFTRYLKFHTQQQ